MKYRDVKDKKALFFDPWTKSNGFQSFPPLPKRLEKVADSINGKEMTLKGARKIFMKSISSVKRKKKIQMMGITRKNIYFIAYGYIVVVHFKFI